MCFRIRMAAHVVVAIDWPVEFRLLCQLRNLISRFATASPEEKREVIKFCASINPSPLEKVPRRGG